jgi:hypothetical protein
MPPKMFSEVPTEDLIDELRRFVEDLPPAARPVLREALRGAVEGRAPGEVRETVRRFFELAGYDDCEAYADEWMGIMVEFAPALRIH